MPNQTRAGTPKASRQRCSWAQSELMIRYHDREWGVPVHDDRGLFEFLILEGAQAGLSWETVLGSANDTVKCSTGSTPQKLLGTMPAK